MFCQLNQQSKTVLTVHLTVPNIVDSSLNSAEHRRQFSLQCTTATENKDSSQIQCRSSWPISLCTTSSQQWWYALRPKATAGAQPNGRDRVDVFFKDHTDFFAVFVSHFINQIATPKRVLTDFNVPSTAFGITVKWHQLKTDTSHLITSKS